MSACSIIRTSAPRRRMAGSCSATCRRAPTLSKPGTRRWARRHSKSPLRRRNRKMSISPSHADPAPAADANVGSHFAATATGAKTYSRFGDYVTLTKPRLNFLVLLTVAAAYSLGAPPDATLINLVHPLLGTFLVAGGAAALNQVWERATDRLMRRTEQRPMADRRISVAEGATFGLVLTAIG